MVAYGNQGGGNAMPSYLQARKPQPMQAQTKPVISPRPEAMPGEVNRGMPPRSPGAMAQQAQQAQPMAGQPQPAAPGAQAPNPTRSKGGFFSPVLAAQQKAAQSPAAVPPAPAQPAGTPPMQQLYDFYKGDLQNQMKQSESEAIADASRRGVYYGTPLTTSQGDIHTSYLRGLGQLQAGMLQNAEQNELQRLGLAAGIVGNTPQAQSGGGMDPATIDLLGRIFGGSGGAAATPRPGPGQPQFKLPPAPSVTGGR